MKFYYHITILLFTFSIAPSDDDDESTVSVLEQNKRVQHRAKLLHFSENRRPPYWGTWRKKSLHITPRKPFRTDPVSHFLVFAVDFFFITSYYYKEFV